MSECETKPAVKSKTNWVGLAMVLMGMVTDPMFQTYFGDLIPPQYMGKLMFASGWIVIALRTFATDTKVSLNWKAPWKD